MTNPLVAVDVGSSRVKLGWFPAASDPEAAAPMPAEVLKIEHSDPGLAEAVARWVRSLDGAADAGAVLASVHPSAGKKTEAALRSTCRGPVVVLDRSQLGIRIEVEQPERVGIDRLLNSVIAARLKRPGQAAIIVDAGTATSVDLVGPGGAFLGGAILPGVSLAAASLHSGTASLPHIDFRDLDPPPEALGKYTAAAIRSGIYWGAVGAVRELIFQIGEEADAPTRVFFTGGDGPLLAAAIPDARFIPDMVLSGIYLASQNPS